MRVEQIGNRALFLIPSVKVYNRKYSKSKQSVASTIHAFLTSTFGGYTCASGNIFGFFGKSLSEYDELREFRVAIECTGPQETNVALHNLQSFLAGICEDIGEECIYLEYNHSAMLIYP